MGISDKKQQIRDINFDLHLFNVVWRYLFLHRIDLLIIPVYHSRHIVLLLKHNFIFGSARKKII